jgi:hypothetical protein
MLHHENQIKDKKSMQSLPENNTLRYLNFVPDDN